MPRVVFVKSARKDNPVAKKGESYYWWKFRYGGKRYSKTPPKQSQLTQSPYFAALYDLQDEVEDTEITCFDDLEQLSDSIREQIAELRDQAQESLDNMPEQLQYAPTGELLQERIDACDGAESEIDMVEEFDEPEPVAEDFVKECPECHGTGQIDEAEFCAEDSDSDRECPECNGFEEVHDEDEFHFAMEQWESDQVDHYTDQKSIISDAIGSCFV